MRSCERCKQPLVDDAAGHSADGRLVCTRYPCQYAEEIGRRVADGSLEIAETESFKVDMAFPAAALAKGVTLETEIQAVLITPLPDDGDECIYAQAFSQDNSGIRDCLDLIDPDFAELASCYAKKTKVEECCEPCRRRAAKAKKDLLDLVNQPSKHPHPFCPHDYLISSLKHEGQSYCECCQSWLGPPPVEGKLCPGCDRA